MEKAKDEENDNINEKNKTVEKDKTTLFILI